MLPEWFQLRLAAVHCPEKAGSPLPAAQLCYPAARRPVPSASGEGSSGFLRGEGALEAVCNESGGSSASFREVTRPRREPLASSSPEKC